jgi:hypothetical protein
MVSRIEGMERERYMSKVHTKGKSKSMNMDGEFLLIMFIRREGWNAVRKRPYQDKSKLKNMDCQCLLVTLTRSEERK